MRRPELGNPQSPEFWLELGTVIAGLPGTVRLLTVAGDGPSFSVGVPGDAWRDDPRLAALAQTPIAEATDQFELFRRPFQSLRTPSVISVALVQGEAFGAGWQLALACDLRIAASDAQFRITETGLGLVPELGGVDRLRELVGYSRALEFCLTGRVIGAQEALGLGLVNAVVEPEQLQQAGDDLAKVLLDRPRDAVTETKALLLNGLPSDDRSAAAAAQHRQLRELHGLGDLEA